MNPGPVYIVLVSEVFEIELLVQFMYQLYVLLFNKVLDVIVVWVLL